MDQLAANMAYEEPNRAEADAFRRGQEDAFRRALLAIEDERLSDPTLSEGDVAYDRAVDDCAISVSAVRDVTLEREELKVEDTPHG